MFLAIKNANTEHHIAEKVIDDITVTDKTVTLYYHNGSTARNISFPTESMQGRFLIAYARGRSTVGYVGDNNEIKITAP